MFLPLPPYEPVLTDIYFSFIECRNYENIVMSQSIISLRSILILSVVRLAVYDLGVLKHFEPKKLEKKIDE